MNVRKWLAVVLALALCLGASLGCGRRKDKGGDWHKDRPRAAPEKADR